MKSKFQRIAFLFPGQGAQTIGMASDFYHNFSVARLVFEEADDLLNRSISSLILNGPHESLTETKNSQVAIYVASLAIVSVVKELHAIEPFVCAGLSLGEYTALTAAGWLPFRSALPLVQHRGQFMNEACEMTQGAMAVIMGLENDVVKSLVEKIALPEDLWIANYNCPGQIVISGTSKGIAAATVAAKELQAKRVLPLQVHGAFHSGLMKNAREKLAPLIEQASLIQGHSHLVMNVPGDFVKKSGDVKKFLTAQVTHPVKWEQGIRAMERENIDLYIEFGPGKTLSGMNKRIGVRAPTLSIDKINDLETIHT